MTCQGKSKKTEQWDRFSREVANHIEGYVIQQYGDYPDPMIEGFDMKDLKTQLVRYVGRIGQNSRGLVEAKRDCLKIAHYACFLYNYLKDMDNYEEEAKA